MSDNPYQAQTNANTSTSWLADQTKVDVDLDNMGEFAKHMVSVKDNLNGHTGYLDLLGRLPNDAWDGDVLPEGAYFRQEMMGNYAELTQYLMHLSTALNNIGMAAQTIADAYSSTDGWSATSLSTVQFAFGDAEARKPGNLPPWVTGQTYWQAYDEAVAAAAKNGSTANTDWKNQEPIVTPNGTVQRSTAPDGRVMEITTFNIPGGGGTVVTTQVLDKEGKVLSSSGQRTNSYLDGNSVKTVTTSYDQHGNETGSKTKSVTYNDHGQVQKESTVNADQDGKQTSATKTDTKTDGSQTITTTTGEGKDEKVVRQISVGTQTEGVVGFGDTPGKDAIERVKDKY